MRALRWLLICCLLPAAVALAPAANEVLPDPLPLRRIEIGPDRVAAELERVQKGILVLLPRADFEAKVQQAALAVDLAASPPRLLKTRYTAQLSNNALVGDATWSAVQTARGPGLLPLGDFNLALNSPPRVDDLEGQLGELDGKTPALLIDKPGQSSIHFGWSRRGTPIGDELHFDLQVPACADASLELKLPKEYRLTASNPTVLVDGPQADAEGDNNIWQISFSGRSRVELTLRRLQIAAPLLLVDGKTRQELSPERVLADYDFHIEALHGTVLELVFDGDRSLQPYDVSLGGVEVKNWQWRIADQDMGSAGGGILVLPLRAPLYGVLPPVSIRCLAPILQDKKDRVWRSPGLRLRGALSRGETLHLHVPAEVQLEGWRPGNFRLAKTTYGPDGGQVLDLVDGGWAPPRAPADLDEKRWGIAFGVAAGAELSVPLRPGAVVKSRGNDVLVTQQSWWQVDTQGSTLTSELACKLSRGQLYHLPLKLPAESQVNQLQVEPKEMLRGWAAAGSQKNPLLLIDLAQPATPERPFKIKVQLRLPPRALSPKGTALPLPDIEPQLPCLREGKLAVSVHSSFRAQMLKSSVPATAPTEDTGLWGQAPVDYHFAYRGVALTGQLRLVARPSQYLANCQSDALIGGNRGTLVTRLTIEPTRGSMDHVDLLVSAALLEPWKVRGESTGPRVASIRRLAGLDVTSGLLALGAPSNLQAAPILAAEPGMQLWRVRFAEPVRGRVTLVLEGPFGPLALGRPNHLGGERTWAIPVVAAVGAGQFEGELAVQSVGAEITTAEADQLQEIARLPAKTALQRGVQQVWRVYRYEGAATSARLPSLRVKAWPVAVELAAPRDL